MTVNNREEMILNTVNGSEVYSPSAFAENWVALQKPANYFLVDVQDNVATFCVEPLERGFGVTLGNALRRIMLSSLRGMAIVSLKIDGVEHEYSSIQGVREDVLEIVLNLKSVVLSSTFAEKCSMRLKAVGPCEVTAGMIETGNDIRVVNPDKFICYLDKGASLDMELTAKTNKGYVSAEENKVQGAPLSTIFIDALFSPVKQVSFKVDNTRVGSDTDYDKLYLTIETNGAIAPDVALALSAKIMQSQLQVFINFADIKPSEEDVKDVLPFDSKLLIKVENLELSVRAQNCLKNENIAYVGDLVIKTESKIMQTPNFGKKSLTELKQLLEKMDLKFGMVIPEWPPADLEDLATKYEDDER